MSRYIGAVCRLCRREGTKLFLKGEKCFNACVLEKGKRKSPPGMHRRLATQTFGCPSSGLGRTTAVPTGVPLASTCKKADWTPPPSPRMNPTKPNPPSGRG